MAEKKKMDAFRLRDVREVLSLEELKEKVNTVDGLMQTLEVSFANFPGTNEFSSLFYFKQNCNREAKAINVDENLLQIDQSFFPILGKFQIFKKPLNFL